MTAKRDSGQTRHPPSAPSSLSYERDERGGIMLYHGGAPGFSVGDHIMPHGGKRQQGCPICDAGGDVNHLPDRVFASTLRLYGKYYASKWGRGWLYVVEPEGALVRSETDPFETYHAPRFRVTKVCERGVELTMSERRHLYRLWRDDDLARGRGSDPAMLVGDRALRRALGIQEGILNR